MGFIPRPETLTRFTDELLPRSVIRKHGSLFFIVTSPSTKKQTWHNLGKTWLDAAPTWKRLVIAHRSPEYVKQHLYAGTAGGPIPTLFLKEMLANARKNAKARGYECTLTLDELQDVALKGGGRCELTGIAFQYGVAAELAGHSTRRKRIWAPSIDRLRGDAGYVAENVRIVCMAVNIARQEFGDEVLLRIAAGLSNIQCSKRFGGSGSEGEVAPIHGRRPSKYPTLNSPEPSTGAPCEPES